MREMETVEKQVDLIKKLAESGVFHLARTILSYLNAESLYSASRVSRSWRRIIREGCLWKRLIAKGVSSDPVWADIVKRRALLPTDLDDTLYEKIYVKIAADIKDLEDRWQNGRFAARLRSERNLDAEVVKFEDHVAIMGFLLDTVKEFDCETETCTKTFKSSAWGMTCMQFDEQMIAIGSHDGKIHLWDRNDPDGSWPCSSLEGGHMRAVRDLKFDSKLMVSCSYCQPLVIVWQIISPREVKFVTSLDWDDNWACNVDFDDKFIVAGSKTGTIRAWDANSYAHVRTFRHEPERLSCCQFGDGLLVGAFETVVKIWHVESGTCLRTLNADGPNLVRFDAKRLLVSELDGVTGATSRIRVCNLKAALDRDVPNDALICATLDLPEDLHLQDMRFNDFKVQCWSIRPCIIYVWDFRHSNSR